MNLKMQMPVVMLCGLLFTASLTNAAGLLPEHVSKICLQGEFTEAKPTFLLICSKQPMKDAQKRQLLSSVSRTTIEKLKSNNGQVILKLSGKAPSADGRIEYFLGTKDDANMPWNNGGEFDFSKWEKYSPDIWDNVCIVNVQDSTKGSISKAIINNVLILINDQVLFDSSQTESYPNRNNINTIFPPIDLAQKNNSLPVLNLAERMGKFRTDYYELGQNPILQLAYADLGQTDKFKYANRGNNWCSEFASYLFRECKITTPDPNKMDVNWENMRAFFDKRGNVYTFRMVASWSNEKKIELIKPGSFVSIITGNGSTHSIIFTTWIKETGDITKWVGISGNNKGMVWRHSPLSIPSSDFEKSMTKEEIKKLEQQFFGVPKGIK